MVPFVKKIGYNEIYFISKRRLGGNMDHNINLGFDSLSMFHHLHAFEAKLHHLLQVLERPKEQDLTTRFHAIVTIMDDEFCHDLLHNLQIPYHISPASLNKTNNIGLNNNSNNNTNNKIVVSRLRLFLHLHCFLECSDSVEALANFLELSLEEVSELIRELHHTFSIDQLYSRLRAYYEHNRKHKEGPEFDKREEYLGSTPSYEPKDITEDRRKRLRKKYGNIEKRLGIPDGPI